MRVFSSTPSQHLASCPQASSWPFPLSPPGCKTKLSDTKTQTSTTENWLLLPSLQRSKRLTQVHPCIHSKGPHSLYDKLNPQLLSWCRPRLPHWPHRWMSPPPHPVHGPVRKAAFTSPHSQAAWLLSTCRLSSACPAWETGPPISRHLPS